MFIGLVVKDLNESWGFFYVQHFRRRAALSNVQRLKAVRHLNNAALCCAESKNMQANLLINAQKKNPTISDEVQLTN
jgi:hypothetical protein